MAGFNRFGSGGLGSLYTGIGGIGQGSANRRDDRFEDRGRRGMGGFDRRDDRDFGRRDPSPRRRRYSPDTSYSSMRGRREDRGDLGSYSMDHMGGHDSFSSRGSMNPQLAQQQQQLMAMVQTQSLLAAIQAQASVAAKQVGPGQRPPSLLQGMRMHDNRMDRNRKRRMSPNRGQMRNRNQHGFNRMQNRQNQQGNNRRNMRRDRERRDRLFTHRKNESGRKSDNDEGPFEEPYVEENPDEEEEDIPEENVEESKETESSKETKTDESKEKPEEPTKEETKEEKEEPKPKTPTEEDVPKSSLNLAGQNVDKLTKSLFDNHRRKYVCKVCKIMCTKETCFRQHLFGRRHIKTWLESQGQSFEAVIFKKATEEAAKTLAARETSKSESSETKTEEQTEKIEEEPASKDSAEGQNDKEEGEGDEVKAKEEETQPSSTAIKTEPEAVKEEKKPEKKVQVLDVKYSCDSRKMAVKNGEYITITSISEAKVKINGFDTGLNTQGCEFVKAVSGFQCRLCRSFIYYGRDVLKHVKGRKHQSNYRAYLHEHPKYEVHQKARNKELDDMLSEKEGETVLLYEVSDEEEEVRRPRYGKQDNTIHVKPWRFVAAQNEEENTNESMEENNHVEQQESESQDDSNTQDKSMDDDDNGDNNANEDEGQEEGEEEGEEEEEAANQSVDSTFETEGVEDSQDTTKDDVEDISRLLQETEEERINSEVIADVSIEGDISLSDLASEEEPAAKKPRTAARRGKKPARGGAQGGRGRGRGRGARKNTRQSPRAVAKSELVAAEDNSNEDGDFMDGFEVIDEVNDDEI